MEATNDERGIGSVVRRLRKEDMALVVLEATGGLEQPAAASLAVAGVPVAIVNPRQVRDFAKATGKLAKTDRIDAAVLAHFAEAVRPGNAGILSTVRGRGGCWPLGVDAAVRDRPERYDKRRDPLRHPRCH